MQSACAVLYRHLCPVWFYNIFAHYLFFLRLIYCSEMYKCLHEFSTKTVPDTSLHETSDLI